MSALENDPWLQLQEFDRILNLTLKKSPGWYCCGRYTSTQHLCPA